MTRIPTDDEVREAWDLYAKFMDLPNDGFNKWLAAHDSFTAFKMQEKFDRQMEHSERKRFLKNRERCPNCGKPGSCGVLCERCDRIKTAREAAMEEYCEFQ